jgi:hypothetical protein
VGAHDVTNDLDLEDAAFFIDLTDGATMKVRLTIVPGTDTTNYPIN